MNAPYYRCVGGSILGRRGAEVPLNAVGFLFDVLSDEAAAAKAAGADEQHDRFVSMGRDLIDARIQAKLWAKASGSLGDVRKEVRS